MDGPEHSQKFLSALDRVKAETRHGKEAWYISKLKNDIKGTEDSDRINIVSSQMAYFVSPGDINPTNSFKAFNIGLLLGFDLFTRNISEVRKKLLLERMQDMETIFKTAVEHREEPRAQESAHDLILSGASSFESFPSLRKVTETMGNAFFAENRLDTLTEDEKIGLFGSIENINLAIGLVHHALEHTIESPLDVATPADDDFQELYTLEEERSYAMGQFTDSEFYRDSIRNNSPALLEYAAQELNENPTIKEAFWENWPIEIQPSSIVLIKNLKTATSLYHRVPSGWRMNGSYGGFTVGTIPSEEDFRLIGNAGSDEAFRTINTDGLYMRLDNPTYVSYTGADLDLNNDHMSVWVPMNYSGQRMVTRRTI
ncbi:MAG: hypothetical protein WA030_02345 [Candidatus Microsaccharimonas sp.]